MRPGRKAFTLIELLIVIAIISLLLTILAPTLRLVRDRAQQVICRSNQHQIWIGVSGYLKEYNNVLHGVYTNWGYWVVPPWGASLGIPGAVGAPVPADDGKAYWGVVYLPFARDKRIWRCPTALASDCDPGPWHDFANEPWVSYGINDQLRYRTNLWNLRKASETIFCHDAYEHRLEGGADTLSAWGGAINISQWRNCTRPLPACHWPDKNHEHEYYRHMQYAEVLWMDGHITSIFESNGTDVYWWWYTGD